MCDLPGRFRGYLYPMNLCHLHKKGKAEKSYAFSSINKEQKISYILLMRPHV
jgi:hypothetical protein